MRKIVIEVPDVCAREDDGIMRCVCDHFGMFLEACDIFGDKCKRVDDKFLPCPQCLSAEVGGEKNG